MYPIILRSLFSFLFLFVFIDIYTSHLWMLDDSLRRMCISLRSVVIQIFWWMCRRKMPYTECTYYKPKCINTTQTPITVSIKTSSYYLQYRWWQFLLYFRNIVSIQFPLRLSISLNRVVVLYTFTQLGCVYTYIQWKKKWHAYTALTVLTSMKWNNSKHIHILKNRSNERI